MTENQIIDILSHQGTRILVVTNNPLKEKELLQSHLEAHTLPVTLLGENMLIFSQKKFRKTVTFIHELEYPLNTNPLNELVIKSIV